MEFISLHRFYSTWNWPVWDFVLIDPLQARVVHSSNVAGNFYWPLWPLSTNGPQPIDIFFDVYLITFSWASLWPRKGKQREKKKRLDSDFRCRIINHLVSSVSCVPKRKKSMLVNMPFIDFRLGTTQLSFCLNDPFMAFKYATGQTVGLMTSIPNESWAYCQFLLQPFLSPPFN